MSEKEMIQSELNAREKLASLSDDELLELASNPNDFDYLMDGLAKCMNPSFVCYAYQYNDIVRKMININRGRIVEDEKLTEDVYKVLCHLNEYDSRSYEFREDFTGQYVSIVRDALGLRKLGISLEDFDKNALGTWKKMSSLDFEDLNNDKYCLAVFNYLVYYHPEYMRKAEFLPFVQDMFGKVDEKDFDTKKEYKSFKRVAKKSMNNLDKYTKKKVKENERFRSYWGY